MTMATMKPTLKRVNLGWIAALLIGGLLGAMIVVGIDNIHRTSHSSGPVAVQTDSQHIDDLREFYAQMDADTAVLGGRMGGINSSDTANDAAIRQGLATAAAGRDLPRADEEEFYRKEFVTRNRDLPSGPEQIGPGQRDFLAPGSLGAPTLTPPYANDVNQTRY
jgi:hypothetical protein